MGNLIKKAILHPLAVYWIIIGAGLVRLFALFYSGQLQINTYWEYGELAKNLIQGHGFSFPFVNEQLDFTTELYPSALMPPGYVFFISPFLLIPDLFWRNLLLFVSQIGLSLMAIHLIFRLINQRLGYFPALISIALQSFLPDLIYASISVGSTTWIHFLLSALLWIFYKPFSRINAVYVILLATILVYFRSETLLFLLLFVVWAYSFQSRKWVLLLFPGVILLLSPWIFRNIIVTGKAVISNNLGVNLYRGNNPGELGDWPPQMEKIPLKFRKSPKTYESNFDSYAQNMAMDWIKQNPEKAAARLPEKLVRFWFLDWPDPRTHQILYWLPWMICLSLGFISIFHPYAKLLQPELLFLFTYTLIVLVFFPQVRYQTMVKFFFLPYSALGVLLLFQGFFKNLVATDSGSEL